MRAVLEELAVGEGAEALVARATTPAVATAVVNHGNPGVPNYLRELLRRLAGAGVTAAVIAGDGRIEPRSVAAVPQAEREHWRTLEFAESYLAMTRELCARLQAESGAVAVVGFCGGGWQAVRLAAEGVPVRRVAALHAAVRFPSEDPRDDLLSYLPGVRSPLQFHFGAEDPLTPAADIASLRSELERLRLPHETYEYPGAGHGFLDPEEHPESSNAEAAELATVRLIDFLVDET